MRPPQNFMESVIFDWMRDNDFVRGGCQKKIAQAAYALAAEIRTKLDAAPTSSGRSGLLAALQSDEAPLS